MFIENRVTTFFKEITIDFLLLLMNPKIPNNDVHQKS
jgi:hypothetical protein